MNVMCGFMHTWGCECEYVCSDVGKLHTQLCQNRDGGHFTIQSVEVKSIDLREREGGREGGRERLCV